MHSSSGYGAIAQLGERVLCKHEVVGSIPSGSTTLRLKATRGAASEENRSVPGEAPKSEDGLPIAPVTDPNIVRENIVPRFVVLTRTSKCVISDIVKRRSIRVGSCKGFCATLHYLQIISALVRSAD